MEVLRFRTAPSAGLTLLLFAGVCLAQDKGSEVADAAISGVVIDGSTETPIAGATVTLSSGSWSVSVITDSLGRFVFLALRPQRAYRIEASKIGYFDAASSPSVGPAGQTNATVVLDSREWFSTARLRLWRPAAIAGTVVDEVNRPIAGAEVTAQQSVFVHGAKVLASGPTTRADDRGRYRLSGLVRGNYVISVRPALATAPPADGQPRMYPETYHPAALAAIDAATVSLDYGEERQAVDIMLHAVLSRSIRGVLQPPAEFLGISLDGLIVRLTREGDRELRVTDVTAAVARPVAGRFEFPRVGPGRYFLEAGSAVPEISLLRLPGPMGTSRAVPQRAGGGRGTVTVQDAATGLEWTVGRTESRNGGHLSGSATVTVEGQDVHDMVIPLANGVTIAGTVAFDAPAKQLVAQGPTPMVATEPLGRMGSVDRTTGRFRIEGLPLRTQFLKVLIPGLTVEEIDWHGTDFSRRAFDLSDGKDVSDVTVKVTARTAAVTGTVRRSDGRPADEAMVLLFPAGAERLSWGDNWTVVAANRKGVYSIDKMGLSGVKPGQYSLVALPLSAHGKWDDPAFVSLTRRFAATIQVGWTGNAGRDLVLAELK
jgi:hypothetical protein